jgi:adenylosuccinate lyase
VADAQAIKDIEKTTNHDVKAVEYWLKSRSQGPAELEASAEFVHFACTSEDINNTSHALMLKAAREQVLLPALDRITDQLQAMAHARGGAHAQPHPRPDRQPHHGGQGDGQRAGAAARGARRIAAVALLAKMNGAVGNYNAHLSAWPDFDWEAFSRQVVEERWAWPSTTTRSRSNRTTAWPSCSTPWCAPTPS